MSTPIYNSKLGLSGSAMVQKPLATLSDLNWPMITQGTTAAGQSSKAPAAPMPAPAQSVAAPTPSTPTPAPTPSAAPKGLSDVSADNLIFNSEARLDKNGNPTVYHPPKDDTGGKEEVAGFTSVYDPNELAIIKATPPEQRKDLILGMIEKKTQAAQNWAQDPTVQGILRDTIFHRGEGGAQAIVNMAVGQPGNKLTPQAVQALNSLHPLEAIQRITDARRQYEHQVYGNRPDLNKGLENRFSNSEHYFTLQYLKGHQS